jgi:hypothetical protein
MFGVFTTPFAKGRTSNRNATRFRIQGYLRPTMASNFKHFPPESLLMQNGAKFSVLMKAFCPPVLLKNCTWVILEAGLGTPSNATLNKPKFIVSCGPISRTGT